MRVPYFASLVVVTAFCSFACSSDKTGTGNQPLTDGGGPGAGGSKGGGVVDGGCVDPSQVFNGVDKCLPKDQAVALCKTQSTTAQPGVKVDDPTCGAGCTCPQCTAQMLACANDPDKYCSTIVACSSQHNCTGVGCYAMNTCQTEIDKAPPCGSDGKCAGLTSGSVALASSLSDCATKTALFMARAGTTCPAACP